MQDAGDRAETIAGGEAVRAILSGPQRFPETVDLLGNITRTSPIVLRKGDGKYNGDYRTQRVILEIYDAMQEAIGPAFPTNSTVPRPTALRAGRPRCPIDNRRRRGQRVAGAFASVMCRRGVRKSLVSRIAENHTAQERSQQPIPVQSMEITLVVV